MVLDVIVLQILLEKRREALMDCLESLKGVYHKPWARTSTDIAVQVVLPSQSIPAVMLSFNVTPTDNHILSEPVNANIDQFLGCSKMQQHYSTLG